MESSTKMSVQPPKAEESENEEQQQQQQHQENSISASVAKLPTASISLSLSSLLSSQLLLHPKQSPLSSPPTCKFKVPTQASTLTHISLASSLSPSKSSLKSNICSIPLQNHSFFRNRRSSEPSNPFGLRKSTIVWFRNDLRVHDNETLTSANNESISVLPVYCFDPKDYGKSSTGFDKTGPYRATFLIESVSDLRRNLRSRGSDLVVRIGKPEVILTELAKAIGAEAVYVQKEVSRDEVAAEEKIEAAMKEEGVEMKYFWGSTLFHIDDLPFELEEMPSNYGGFREKVRGLQVRKTIQALDQLRGLPSRGDVESGEVPTLLDLGLNQTSTMSKEGRPAANASLVGGETEALQRLQKFATECQTKPTKDTKHSGHDSLYGANFSCKISPWLAMGCLSPRFMFDEIKKASNRTVSATSTQTGTGKVDGGMNWLLFELLWRDFFRFITKKYSSCNKKLQVSPVTACTGALA